MPNFKVVVQYTQPNKGFSEVYYRTATTLAAAANLPNEVTQSWLANKHQLTTLVKIRVSDTLNNRSSVIIPVNNTGTDATGGGPDITGTAAIVTLVSPSIGSSRKLWLRGLSDDAVKRTAIGQDLEGGMLGNEIAALINVLARNSFTVRSLTKIGTPPNVFTNFTQYVAVAGAGVITLSFLAGPAPIVGSLVIISQINQKVLPGLKGIFPILATTATSITVGYNPLNTATAPLAKGRWRPATYNFGAIDNVLSAFTAFGTRATGRNPLGGRGARRGARGIRLA